ncbi:NADH-quinone oxidoreductase subunit J [Geobacter hydrogenophilus]|uniref:NADH-quinone oxidoreductase subunit J n=1 Tax=Geobacter hydrogenophilus TaxID=40983 RepID=A0A9W6G0F9_9BACT|nr:NADH-quinone oxidoreductase subunit J [Geobacter hydrogenophilus]MBT0893936.1 NADH-quinone oxidoreductase subunit J [Geobacter hydrogenophilus]GLI38118.1 NADH dehydrogenase subunit J [Geobacter hydrogenophilus]
MESALFYILSAVTVTGTAFAITEKHAVHAIVYLVTSFFALAVIFFLLGAPVVAIFEVIIYAGAIMVLFLFVIMMLDLGHPERARLPGIREWWPALALGTVTLASALALVVSRAPAISAPGKAIGVKEFALALFGKYGVAVEVISMQLLFALVGALYLARKR